MPTPRRARSLMSSWRHASGRMKTQTLAFSLSLSLSLSLSSLNGVLILFPPSTPLNRERTTNEARGASSSTLVHFARSVAASRFIGLAGFLRCDVEPVQIKRHVIRFGRLGFQFPLGTIGFWDSRG